MAEEAIGFANFRFNESEPPRPYEPMPSGTTCYLWQPVLSSPTFYLLSADSWKRGHEVNPEHFHIVVTP